MHRLTALLLCGVLAIAGCGGGGSNTPADGGGGIPTGPAANVATITVDAGPAAAVSVVNEPFVSVTICPPGDAAHCQTIDHILVDTGSTGLRIIASLLNSSTLLSQLKDTSGNSIVECTTFADGYSWGPVKRADVIIASEQASGISVQIISDPNFTTVPATCSSTGGVQENTVATFGANGVLGVGPFLADCDNSCATSPAQPGFYYACSNTACLPAAVPIAQQVSNPVAFFTTDNNGVIVELPSVFSGGAATVTGSLIFGIGTQGNNMLGNASVFLLDPVSGYFITKYNGVDYPSSFIDSGSNALYFNDSNIAACANNTRAPGFFCPAVTANLSASNSDGHGVAGTVNFSVMNADSLMTAHTNYYAFANLAAPGFDPTAFDWGLPFFFGRRVITAIERKNTMGGVGPYFAY